MACGAEIRRGLVTFFDIGEAQPIASWLSSCSNVHHYIIRYSMCCQTAEISSQGTSGIGMTLNEYLIVLTRVDEQPVGSPEEKYLGALNQEPSISPRVSSRLTVSRPPSIFFTIVKLSETPPFSLIIRKFRVFPFTSISMEPMTSPKDV